MKNLTGLCVLLCLSGVVGCGQHRTTDTSRTAVEQLLLSTAADDAVAQLDLTLLRGKQVFLDASHFDAVDKVYVVDLIRETLGKAGAILVAELGNADILVEIRSGALGTERRDYLIGLPAIPVPIPMAGTLTTPEMAFYKQDTQEAIAKFALHATRVEDGQQILVSGPVSAIAYHTRRIILLIPFRSTNIPELGRR